MNKGFSHCLQIFPTSNFEKTSEFYERIGFRAVNYFDAKRTACMPLQGLC